jgi:putative CocE/NonD family hydrolase
VPETFEWIPMSDGICLAATLYLPETDDAQPALLEALPYRKDDVTAYGSPEYRRLRDEGGYAVCRVDLRGTGSSEGVATDEYPPREQKDLCEVIAWLARQPWCSGKVGMYGTSYSGFNSIQVAMQRPPELAAICTIFSTDDRYTDDVHYGGGIRRALDLVDYPLYMVAMNALPPVPRIAGDDWRRAWERRVEALEPWLLRWVAEQTDGPYWRHGSLRPHYERIQCATLIVAGWADGYHNMTFRTFAALRCPKRMLIGPWAHTSTETSRPGPRIDLVPEMIRWWDRWLRGRDNGLEEQPPVTLFARRSTRPAGDRDTVRGTFRFEPGWPLDRSRVEVHRLSSATVVGRGSEESDDIVVRGDVGAHASIWCAGTLPFGQPLDQRPDEAYSLCYEWQALSEELEVLGYPRVELRIRSTAPVAFVSAKLCDVFPDGTSALVSRTAFNLTHRDSHSEPRPLTPGEPYDVGFELDATSWVWEPGHRVRLDLAGADWPNVWPPPEPVELSIERDGSALVLPVLRGPPPVGSDPHLAPPAPGPARAGGLGSPGSEANWHLAHDMLRATKSVTIGQEATTDLSIGGRLRERYEGAAEVSTEDPGDARVRGRAGFVLEWPEATVATESRLTMHSDRDNFHVSLELDVSENGQRRWARSWERTYPRTLA